MELADGEEATLVVANTPTELVQYDAFDLSSEVTRPLDYSFTLSGATVAAGANNVGFEVLESRSSSTSCAFAASSL